MADDANEYKSVPPPTGTRRKILIAILLIGDLLASFMQSMMNVALHDVSDLYHISLSVANWMVLGYTIVTATVIIMSAFMLKRLGLRKIMMTSFVFAFLGSMLGFFAWNYPVLLIARLLQAVNTGICFPVINEALLVISPKHKAAKLLATVSFIIGVGLAFSPVIAGVVITYVGLRFLFLIPAVMAFALFCAGHFYLQDLSFRGKSRLDVLSVVLGFCGLACFMYGLNEVTHTILSSVIIMAVGLVFLGLFIWRQLRIKDPLLKLGPFKYHVFSIGETIVALSMMTSLYMSLLVPLYLEGVASYTTFLAGCACILPILCYAISCLFSSHILRKKGITGILFAGIISIIIGFVGMFIFSDQKLIIAVLVFCALAYAGIGIFYPSLKSVDLEDLPQELSSDGSSIHSAVVQLGNSVASALFVGIMSGDVDSMVAHGISKANAYAAGFSHTLLIAIGILAGVFILAMVYTRLIRKSKNAHGQKKESS